MGKRRKKNDDFELIEKKRDKKLYGKFPRPIMQVDRSGRIKQKTLESLLFLKYSNPTEWFSPKGLLSDSEFARYPYLSGWRCISQRLLRYTRQGPLERKKFGRCFKYRLTRRGEDRLEYLWKKFQLLSPSTDQTLSEEARQAKNRLYKGRLYLGIRMNQDRLKILEEMKQKLLRMDPRPIYEILPPRILTPTGHASLFAKTDKQPVREVYHLKTKTFKSYKADKPIKY